MGMTGGASDGSEATAATAYCTSLEVARFLHANDGADFSTETKPTKVTVEAIISRMDVLIDERTRHAWRAVTVTNEYHDFHRDFYRSGIAYPTGRAPCRCVHLNHRSVHTFTSGTHKIEIRKDGEFVDLILEANGYEEGIGKDYWINYEEGIIYFEDEEPDSGRDTVRMTYEFGEMTVPGDIKEACIKLTAIDLTYSEDWTVMAMDNTDRIDLRGKVDAWKKDIDALLASREELIIA